MTLKLDTNEANALVRILDAALRSGGVNILNEAAWLQNKLQKADAESKQPRTGCGDAAAEAKPAKPLEPADDVPF